MSAVPSRSPSPVPPTVMVRHTPLLTPLATSAAERTLSSTHSPSAAQWRGDDDPEAYSAACPPSFADVSPCGATQRSMCGAQSPASLLPSSFHRPLLPHRTQACAAAQDDDDGQLWQNSTSPPPALQIGCLAEASHGSLGTTSWPSRGNPSHALDDTTTEEPHSKPPTITVGSTPPNATSSTAASSKITSDPTAPANTTSTSIIGELTGSSDSRQRVRPPRLALRLFDQLDDADSSLDQSRIGGGADHITQSSPAAAHMNSSDDPVGAAPLFDSVGSGDETKRRGSCVLPSPPLFTGVGDDRESCAVSRLPSGGRGWARSGTHSGRHAPHHDNDDPLDNDLAGLLFVQTPLSPCASFTAPQFAVMTARSSTSHFSPVGGTSGFERANSLSFGPATSHKLRASREPVSSRVIVERHLRRQQQQGFPSPGASPSSHVPQQGSIVPGSGYNSVAYSHHSAYSGSPLWCVSRGLSPQSPVPTFAVSSASPPPLAAVARTAETPFSVFPSAPASGRQPPSAPPTPTAQRPRLAGPAGVEAGDHSPRPDTPTYSDANALAVTGQRRRTLEPGAGLLIHTTPRQSPSVTEEADNQVDGEGDRACVRLLSVSPPHSEAGGLSPPGTVPRDSRSPTLEPRRGQPHVPLSACPSTGSTRDGSSPRFSASASYAALTLGKLMTPEEWQPSPRVDNTASLSSFRVRSGATTPARARPGVVQGRRGQIGVERRVAYPRSREGRLGRPRDGHRNISSSPEQSPSPFPAFNVGSADGTSPLTISPFLSTMPSQVMLGSGRLGRREARQRSSATRYATPPPLCVSARSGSPVCLSSGHTSVTASHTDPTRGLPAVLGASLEGVMSAANNDDVVVAVAEGAELPSVACTTSSEASRPCAGQTSPIRRHDVELDLPSVMSVTGSAEAAFTLPSSPPVPSPTAVTTVTRRRRSAPLPPDALTRLAPLFGQLSAKGCRSHQEDNVLLLPDIHLSLAKTAEALSTPDATGPTEPDARTFACFGVFDGHNGDQVSTMAQKYFLDHFEVSYQHYHEQRCQRHEEPGAGDQTTVNGTTMAASQDEQRTLSAALVQTLLHLDVTIYDQLRESRAEAGSTACVMACTLPELAHVSKSESASQMKDSATSSAGDADGACGVDYLDIAIANLGDSRAVVGNVATGAMILQTVDHRVRTFPTEEARIKRCGGTVEFDRVEGCYDVTRGLGDYHLKCSPATWWLPESSPSTTTSTLAVDAASPTPCGSSLASNGHPSGQIRGNVIGNIADVYEVRVGTGDFVILASDGVWDRISSEEAVAFVADALQPFFESCALSFTAVMADTDKDGRAVTTPPLCSPNKGTDASAAAREVGLGATAGKHEEVTASLSQHSASVDPTALRAKTTSSGGLTSECLQRSPREATTTLSPPAPLDDSPLQTAEGRETEIRSIPHTPRANRLDEAGTESEVHTASPRLRSAVELNSSTLGEDGQCERGSACVDSLWQTPLHMSDSARSPSWHLPSTDKPKRTTTKPTMDGGNTMCATPSRPTFGGRRCRRLSSVDLVQREALSSDVLQRRAQQQQQQPHQEQPRAGPTTTDRNNTSGSVRSPSTFGTPSSRFHQPSSQVDLSIGQASTSAHSPSSYGSPSRTHALDPVASFLWTPTPDGMTPEDGLVAHTPISHTDAGALPTLSTTGDDIGSCSSSSTSAPHTPRDVSHADKTGSALAGEFQTPSRPSLTKEPADVLGTTSLAQMVRKVSAALADYVLLERNSSDNVTVVLVVFAPCTATGSSQPLLATSVRGYQSP